MTISIQAASPLRYSLGINQPAPVIDDDSAFFPANLILNANDDQIDNYALRIFDDSQPGKPAFEQVISFSVSGIRPSAPAIRIINAPDLRNAFLVQFELVNEVDIFYSINNPNPEAFRRYVDPVMVQAAGDQRESFLIRAYSIDLFGNRSRLISSFDYIVDPLSIYIDTTRQIADADGSPLKPFNNFDDALAKTLQTGRHSLMVRGAITITLPLLINQDIAIHGGWDEAWNNSRGNSTIILRTTDGSAGGSLQVEGASLSFSNLDIAIFQEKPLPVIDIANGELLAVNTKFELGADCGSHLVKSDNSTITFSGCGFSYEDSLAARLFDIRRTELHCADSEIVIASSVRFFQCLTASDSRVEFSTVNASITPFLGVNSFILNNSALVLKNSQLLVSAGNSTIRFISAYSAQVEMVNTYLATTGSSAVELMNLNGGSSITILASTLINTAASFTCFSILDGSVVVGNSILQSVALSSILLQVGNSRNVFLTANCFSGFDFISQGTLSLQDITALNNLMQSIGTYRLASPVNARALPFKPNFIEAPSTTFLPPVKGMRLLSSNSACIGYAIPLGTAFSGNLGFQGAE
ncbi:MAG: hypothetical protein A2004_01655 [Spirochaetes bacterium GWC1_61_12]|nr:MAG: hypothetical protein A2004_01655 [Spirochaetes bacterium GWC1_61_12]OHD61749.1 MAG: hypothetical protein A2Y32_13375 [Spirochaetes bacterium GWF1_60_12]